MLCNNTMLLFLSLAFCHVCQRDDRPRPIHNSVLLAPARMPESLHSTHICWPGKVFAHPYASTTRHTEGKKNQRVEVPAWTPKNGTGAREDDENSTSPYLISSLYESLRLLPHCCQLFAERLHQLCLLCLQSLEGVVVNSEHPIGRSSLGGIGRPTRMRHECPVDNFRLPGR